jgi:uncharacterized cupredoxin-like copper-binding protein
MRTSWRRAGALAAVAVLAVGVGACGDDDDDASTDTTASAAEADPAAYCDALLEFNGKVMQTEIDEDSSADDVKAAGEELAPLFQTMADNAPASVADDVADLNDRAIQPLLEGEGEAFNADDTFEAYTAVVDRSADECDLEPLAVTAVDYAFQGVPASIPAGTYAMELTNSGSEEHEMILFRKKPGVTQSIEEIVNLPEDQSDSLVEFGGAAFAPPGESGSTLAELEPGEYGMACFIPVGGAEDGPPHFTRGMLAEFTVE